MADSPAPAPAKAPEAPSKPALWHKVHNAVSVQTPDKIDNPRGAVIDASVFPEYLLNHYIEQGYLRPVASQEG